MNISDLKNINVSDLKNIDFVKLKSILEKNQNIVLNVFIVVLSLFLIVKIFISNWSAITLIKQNIQLSDKKSLAISRYDKNLKDLNEFTNKLTDGISGSSIIGYLTDFAEARSVHILTFSSAKSIKSELYERSTITLKISVNDYSNLILFVKDIENSGLNLRVDKWVGTLTAAAGAPRNRSVADPSRDNQDESIVVAMDVSSIKFIKE